MPIREGGADAEPAGGGRGGVELPAGAAEQQDLAEGVGAEVKAGAELDGEIRAAFRHHAGHFHGHWRRRSHSLHLCFICSWRDQAGGRVHVSRYAHALKLIFSPFNNVIIF
ncbi:unnamed protein product [Linum trigynum]|uniref:Uncharacterized protein n=1 Tax=Linum trigynum TaxID=586398 RepID=A0AAV2EYS8_9ROSI